MDFEEYEYNGTVFIYETKEHILRMAAPGSSNVIIRGILRYGQTVEIPFSIDGSPITSFSPMQDLSFSPPYPGVKKLCIPALLGKFSPEETGNLIFPDLAELAVDRENRIFCTDGQMLYKNNRKELFLSMAAGRKREAATVPASVLRIGEYAFSETICEEILFENPDIEAESTSFLCSAWAKRQENAIYVGNMLFQAKPDTNSLIINEGVTRIHENAFSQHNDKYLEIFLPESLKELRKCSLENVDTVTTYEGSIEKLASAMNSSASKKQWKTVRIIKEDCKQLKKAELMLTRFGDESTSESGEKFKDFALPGRMNPVEASYFDDVFASKPFDLRKYDNALSLIEPMQEKLDFTIYAILQRDDFSDTPYPGFATENGAEIVQRMIEILTEKDICLILKKGLLNERSLEKAVRRFNENGLNAAAAYALQAAARMNRDNLIEL